MNSNPLVSIIIPSYNRASLLKEAVQSCICQTYRLIECIIVDDGSTDNTKEVINELIINNPESFTLKYIYQQNAGSQVARNTGTVASTGEFIQYLDSDDLLYPEKIKNQVEFLQTNKDCDGVWGGWAKGTPENNELIKSLASSDLITQFFTEHCIVNFSFLMRRNLVEKIGSWDVSIQRNQEIDFQVRGLLEGANYQYQPQICGLWRIHEGKRIGSTTGSKEILNFYKKWEKILKEKGLFTDQTRNNIANLFFWMANKNKEALNENIVLLKEVVRLNPDTQFINTSKMKFLRKVFGLTYSIKFWIFRSRLSQSKTHAS